MKKCSLSLSLFISNLSFFFAIFASKWAAVANHFSNENKWDVRFHIMIMIHWEITQWLRSYRFIHFTLLNRTQQIHFAIFFFLSLITPINSLRSRENSTTENIDYLQHLEYPRFYGATKTSVFDIVVLLGLDLLLVISCKDIHNCMPALYLHIVYAPIGIL